MVNKARVDPDPGSQTAVPPEGMTGRFLCVLSALQLGLHDDLQNPQSAHLPMQRGPGSVRGAWLRGVTSSVHPAGACPARLQNCPCGGFLVIGPWGRFSEVLPSTAELERSLSLPSGQKQGDPTPHMTADPFTSSVTWVPQATWNSPKEEGG